jgi:hypothetical protein
MQGAARQRLLARLLDAAGVTSMGLLFADVEGRRWIEIGPAKFATQEEDQAYESRRGPSYDSGPDSRARRQRVGARMARIEHH